jgi:hypothetical protein
MYSTERKFVIVYVNKTHASFNNINNFNVKLMDFKMTMFYSLLLLYINNINKYIFKFNLLKRELKSFSSLLPILRTFRSSIDYNNSLKLKLI